MTLKRFQGISIMRQRFPSLCDAHVAEIRKNTCRDDWYYIPGKLNVGYVCIRPLLLNIIYEKNRYLSRPQFLHDQNIYELTNNDQDFQLRIEQIQDTETPSLNVVTDSQVIKPVIKWYNVSPFTELVRAIAYLKSFKIRLESLRENRLQIVGRNNLDESRNTLLSLLLHQSHRVP